MITTDNREISLKRDDVKALRKAYQEARRLEMPQFNFKGDVFVTQYIKYVLEAIDEGILKPEQ